jgi:hypothetical protein
LAEEVRWWVTFLGAFQCSKCGKDFVIDLGAQWMGERKTAKNIGAEIGEMAKFFAGSCLGHEKDCGGSNKIGGDA